MAYRHKSRASNNPAAGYEFNRDIDEMIQMKLASHSIQREPTQVVLAPIKDPVTTYSTMSPQKVTLDPGTTVHHVINSRRATRTGSTAFSFNIVSGDLASHIVSRLSPVSISARLTINNINRFNHTINITTSGFPTAFNVTLVDGCYSPATFAVMLETEINAEFAIRGIIYTITVTYDGANDTLLLDVGAGNTFHLNDCIFLTEGGYLMDAPDDINDDLQTHTFIGISMIYSPYIHVSASKLTQSAKYESSGGGGKPFMSIAWLEPWIKTKSYGAGSAFTSSHYTIYGTALPTNVDVALLDDYGQYLSDYCPDLSSDFFSFTIAFTA
jgi:hypothetical protein